MTVYSHANVAGGVTTRGFNPYNGARGVHATDAFGRSAGAYARPLTGGAGAGFNGSNYAGGVHVNVLTGTVAVGGVNKGTGNAEGAYYNFRTGNSGSSW